jgi:CDP-diacylglycerol--glycerol-3-phosphate 3-phosphatidyltransferase
LERLYVLAPALLLLGAMVAGFVVYCLLHLVGRPPHIASKKYTNALPPFVIRYLLWVISPLERLLVSSHVSPNSLTLTSLFVCAGAGLSIGTGHMATAAWLYALAGVLDVMDGRLARATGQQTKAGGFLDSVADRWGELFVFSGFAWFLHESPWLGAVMFALAGSIMVSYTRARGESLGIKLDGGSMQRAERIVLVATGTLITAWFDAADSTAEYGPAVIGVALLMVGFGSSVTAIGRWIQGYKLLRELDQKDVGRSNADIKPVQSVSGKHAEPPPTRHVA